MPTVELSFPSGLPHLKLVRAVLHETCNGRGTDMAEMHWLVQATAEAVSNVVRHAYAGEKDRPVRLTVRAEENDVEVRIVDEGRSFQFQKDDAFDLDAFAQRTEAGGLGLHMIRRIADRVEYRREGGRNVLSIHRRLRGSGATLAATG